MQSANAFSKVRTTGAATAIAGCAFIASVVLALKPELMPDLPIHTSDVWLILTLTSILTGFIFSACLCILVNTFKDIKNTKNNTNQSTNLAAHKFQVANTKNVEDNEINKPFQ